MHLLNIFRGVSEPSEQISAGTDTAVNICRVSEPGKQILYF
jgi:hypothetical protein